MPQSPADRLIKRISALHRSVQLDEGGKLSAMERDLMLGYLRELYEIYATHRESNPYAPPTVDGRPPTPAESTRLTPGVTRGPSPSPAASASSSAPPPAASASVPLSSASTPAPAPPATPPPSTPASAAAPTPPSDLDALFTDDGPSSRFGRQPLSAINKGLTINTRILFTRELFGGDGDLLGTSVRTLDASGSFAAARPVLKSMARRFDWTAESRLETAREFIELVRRRYV